MLWFALLISLPNPQLINAPPRPLRSSNALSRPSTGFRSLKRHRSPFSFQGLLMFFFLFFLIPWLVSPFVPACRSPFTGSHPICVVFICACYPCRCLFRPFRLIECNIARQPPTLLSPQYSDLPLSSLTVFPSPPVV